MTGKYLITTTEWFYAPDGKQYRAVWGEVKLIPTNKILGLEPNRVTANWTLQIGDDTNHILIGGCQINYSVKCENRPNTDRLKHLQEGKEQEFDPAIYIPGETEKGSIINTIDPDKSIALIRLLSSLPHRDKRYIARLIDAIEKIGVVNYTTHRDPYARYPNTIVIKWGNGDETKEEFGDYI